LSQDLGQRLVHVRELVPPYTNRQDFVELFPCPLISKNPETCPRTVTIPQHRFNNKTKQHTLKKVAGQISISGGPNICKSDLLSEYSLFVCSFVRLFSPLYLALCLFLFLFQFLEFINGVCGLRWMCCGGIIAYCVECTKVVKNWLCLLFCFIKPIMGNRYGPGVSSASQGGRTHDPRSPTSLLTMFPLG